MKCGGQMEEKLEGSIGSLDGEEEGVLGVHGGIENVITQTLCSQYTCQI